MHRHLLETLHALLQLGGCCSSARCSPCPLASPRCSPHYFPPAAVLRPQAELHTAIKRSIQATGLFEGQARTREVNMLAEMTAYGDSGAFLEKVRWMCCMRKLKRTEDIC